MVKHFIVPNNVKKFTTNKQQNINTLSKFNGKDTGIILNTKSTNREKGFNRLPTKSVYDTRLFYRREPRTN